MTILIVDDNARVRAILRALVEPLGARVFECADGLSAVESFGDIRPDVVLMDIRMPRLDGLQATRRIVALNPSACVVIVSDDEAGDGASTARSVGARAFIPKEEMLTVPAVVMGLRPA